jgi:hypothetical protein
LIWLIITVYLMSVCGCSVTNHLTLHGNEIPLGSNFKIRTVILKDGQIIDFDKEGGMYVNKMRDGQSYHAIVGTSLRNEIEVDPENVLEMKIDQQGSGGAGSFFMGMFVGIPVGAGLLVLIVAMSVHGD